MPKEISDLKRSLQNANSNLADVTKSISNTLERFKNQQEQIHDICDILKGYLQEVVSVKNNTISTAKQFKLSPHIYINLSCDSTYYKDFISKKRKKEEIAEEITNEMLVYVTKLLSKINEYLDNKYKFNIVYHNKIEAIVALSDSKCLCAEEFKFTIDIS